VRTAITLAQEAENATAYRRLCVKRAALVQQLADIEAELFRMDPDWSREVVAPCSPLAKFRKERDDDDPTLWHSLTGP
jgi:hypothetical protein